LFVDEKEERTYEPDDRNMGSHETDKYVTQHSRDEHRQETDNSLHRSVVLVVLEIKLGRVSWFVSNTLRYEPNGVAKNRVVRTCTQNVQERNAHQFVKAIIIIAAMRPFARVQIDSFNNGGGVNKENGDSGLSWIFSR